MANYSTKFTKSTNVSDQIIHHPTGTLIYMNDGVRICSEACACCWDKTNPESYEDKVIYLGKRVKTGHTSILEHSNLVVLIKMPSIITKDNTIDILSLVDTLCASQYLHARFAQASDDTPYILIGGSIRGFSELYELSNIIPSINSIIRAISEIIYANFDARLFAGLIKEAYLDEEKFTGVEPDPVSKYFNPIPETPFYEDDKVKFINVDNVRQIKANLFEAIGENIFSNRDISRVASISILFKDMSRTATHQLVRHRNGITQESQRYVDYSNAAFADPTSFKPDKYDPNKIYEFNFGGTEFAMTSNQIGEAIIGIYQDLLSQGMLKEDARSFLPGNVKCRKLYMTFTYASYLKFLELRCHPAAQAEIRSFAIDCRDASDNIFKSLEETYNPVSVDEIISDKEKIMQNIIENTPELKEN